MLALRWRAGKCYLALYVEFLLAFQERARELAGDGSITLPLAIMTSDDTHNGAPPRNATKTARRGAALRIEQR